MNSINIDCLGAICGRLEAHDVRALMCTNKAICGRLTALVYIGPQNTKNVSYSDYIVSYRVWKMKSLGLKESVPKCMSMNVLHREWHCDIRVTRRLNKHRAITLSIIGDHVTAYLYMIRGAARYTAMVFKGEVIWALKGVVVWTFKRDISINRAIYETISIVYWGLNEACLWVSAAINDLVNRLSADRVIEEFMTSMQMLELMASM